jgi:hypothetical protein
VSLALLREMFAEMVVKKDAAKIPVYYHERFRLCSNGEETDYASFLESHERYYASPITYRVELDEETLVEDGDRVAGRVWITTSRPGEAPTRIEVILIAAFEARRIVRLWELTYPSWSELPAFAEHARDD